MFEPSASSEPFGGYVHVPWCRRRCPYCDFYFEVGAPSAAYVDGLRAELLGRASDTSGKTLASLYFGGGTPTALEASQLAAIIQMMSQVVGFTDSAEITVEANPEDLSGNLVRDLRNAGVNRLSLGIQSFDDSSLRFLGRGHDRATALQALVWAKEIQDVSVDLIIGLPDDSAQRVLSDIEIIADHEIAHVSVYLLTVEPLTPMWKQIQAKRRPDVDSDRQADLYAQMQDMLARAGYQQYEVSSFSLPMRQSAHNRLYWSQGTYVGLGPAAHSMLLNSDGSVSRRANIRSVTQWLADPAGPVFEIESLPPETAFREALAFGLRDLDRGIHVNRLEQRHGVNLSKEQERELRWCVEKGWLKGSSGHYRLTQKGVLFADAVARALL